MITATSAPRSCSPSSVTSLVIVRRRLPYEWWYAVHLLAYAGIALAWFHQIPTGNELVLDRSPPTTGASLFIATLAVLVGFRIVVPLVNAFRYRLRVAEVVEEGARRRLAADHRPQARAARTHGRAVLPLAVSHARPLVRRRIRSRSRRRPTGGRCASPSRRSATTRRSSASSRSGRASSPKGRSASSPRRAAPRARSLLIAGGIGITPVRALLESWTGDVVVLYRVVCATTTSSSASRARASWASTAHYVVGDHESAGGASCSSPGHLRELVPDIAERDVFVCGPPGDDRCAIRNLRHAHVPRRHIHAERFAL